MHQKTPQENPQDTVTKLIQMDCDQLWKAAQLCHTPPLPSTTPFLARPAPSLKGGTYSPHVTP